MPPPYTADRIRLKSDVETAQIINTMPPPPWRQALRRAATFFRSLSPTDYVFFRLRRHSLGTRRID